MARYSYFEVDVLHSTVINLALYVYLFFEFRVRLLLAADIGEHHHVCANTQGCHQRGGQFQADAQQH